MGGGAAAAAATVTPVLTASDAGIDDRPGVNAALVEVKTAASPQDPPPIPQSAGGPPAPHQQPGGAFTY